MWNARESIGWQEVDGIVDIAVKDAVTTALQEEKITRRAFLFAGVCIGIAAHMIIAAIL